MGRQSDSKRRKIQMASERHEGGRKGFVADSSTSESEPEVASSAKTINEVLAFKEGAKLPAMKAVYTGQSRANEYKKSQKALAAAQIMKNSPKIDRFFASPSMPRPPPSESIISHEAPPLTILEALEKWIKNVGFQNLSLRTPQSLLMS